MAKKKTDDTLKVVPFKSDYNSVWCNMKHYMKMEGKIICAAGGTPTEEELEKVKQYFNNG